MSNILKKAPKLLWLETAFLFLILYVVLIDFSVYARGFEILHANFDFFWSTGAPIEEVLLSTSFIGYLFAIAYQKSLGKNRSKWSIALAIIGLTSFLFNVLKLFVPLALDIRIEPALVILIIDWARHYKSMKA